jgi:hypothetical protein
MALVRNVTTRCSLVSPSVTLFSRHARVKRETIVAEEVCQGVVNFYDGYVRDKTSEEMMR